MQPQQTGVKKTPSATRRKSVDERSAAKVAQVGLPGPSTLESFSRLNGSWTLWYTNGSCKTAANFENCLIPIGTFNTAEAYWTIVQHLIPPSELPKGTEYHLFREGIRPMWEDPANADGATLLFRLKRGYLNYCWQAICLALIGEQLGPDINGAVAAKKFNDDHLSIWSACYSPNECTQVANHISAIVGFQQDSPCDYKSHSGTLLRATKTTV